MRLLKLLNLIKKGRFNSSQGFSLVELMVVVAIIGILAAIAIPNYQKFQARSKQTEARAQLSGIFASARSFIVEWAYGSSNLRQIGYAVESTNMRYNCGWPQTQKNASGGDNINTSSRPSGSGYRGPTVADDTMVSTFIMQPTSIATTVNEGTTGNALTSILVNRTSGSTADGQLSITPAAGAVAGSCSGGTCTGSETTSSACTTCSGTWTAPTASVEGSMAMDNSVPGSIPFIIGCIGDIDGSMPDEWTMNDAKQLINTKQGI